MPNKTFHNGYEGGFSYEKLVGDPGVLTPIDVDITEFTLEESNPSVDVTTTGDYDPVNDRAFTRRWRTRSSASGTISFPIPDGLSIADFRPGKRLTNVVLKSSDDLEWTFPEIYIPSSTPNPGGMDEVNRLSFNWESSGPYYGPGDTIPTP